MQADTNIRAATKYRLASLGGHSITTWRVEGEEVSRKSTEGHLTKGRQYVKYPYFSTRGEGGQKWVKFGPRSC